MYKLRDYQETAISLTISHFRNEQSPAVIVLPTGAGKSLVIAELARLAQGRVLVLAHVKELVEQNYQKLSSFNQDSGIYSAGLNRKDINNKIIFGSIQSIARAPNEFFKKFTLLIIDECHRISMDGETQYFQVISKLREINNSICILGLTATPYRLGQGWIYQYHSHKKIIRTNEDRFFKKCIYELSLQYLIKNNYLTPPLKIDSPVACYDFESLKLNGTRFIIRDIENILKDQKRITPVIIKNIIEMAEDRSGVMIFTSSVKHAEEILRSLPPFISAMIVGDTENSMRDEIIEAFKLKKLKFLVNVSVLTTGFDAPHVDVIAILRPTESVSLYQQIVGRGLRLAPNKKNCLILDYTGQGHNIFSPEIEDNKPSSHSVAVEIVCPACGLINDFWGLLDDTGELLEHFGRKCQGAIEDPITKILAECGFRFRFKKCDQCGAENDIAVRSCHSCLHLLVDNDKKLKEAMTLKDAHVMKVDTMTFEKDHDKKGNQRLVISYYDVDAENLKEYFYLDSPENLQTFYFNFTRMHIRIPEKNLWINNIDDVITNQKSFRMPMFIIARKNKFFWEVREKVF